MHRPSADLIAEDLLDAASGVLDESLLGTLARCLDSSQPGANPARRYRCLVAALDRLPVAGPGGSPVADFLCADAVVLARMSIAAEVMRADGIEVGPDPGALISPDIWDGRCTGSATGEGRFRSCTARAPPTSPAVLFGCGCVAAVFRCLWPGC